MLVIGVSYEIMKNERWNSELNLMSEIKTQFGIVIKMIDVGEAEQSIIDAENNLLYN